MFVFFIHLWNFGNILIFLASAGSFNVKNDNCYTFFSLSWLQILNLPALLQIKNTRIGTFPGKRSVLQNPDWERTNQSTGICLELGLPYNNAIYCMQFHIDWKIKPGFGFYLGVRTCDVLCFLIAHAGVWLLFNCLFSWLFCFLCFTCIISEFEKFLHWG